jgi:Holliday junction resolvasome RuvABC ATP-dependent DNA helicase subunit
MTNSQKTDGKQADGKFAPGNSNGKKFPPGTSGNPSGRPRLTKLTEALREQLSEEMPNAPERTVAEVIARTLIKLAIAGDVQAIKEIGNRTEGLPKQAIDLDLQINDWKSEVQRYGLSESDIIAEAQLLIAESTADSGGE